jgi:hypothetical protein
MHRGSTIGKSARFLVYRFVHVHYTFTHRNGLTYSLLLELSFAALARCTSGGHKLSVMRLLALTDDGGRDKGGLLGGPASLPDCGLPDHLIQVPHTQPHLSCHAARLQTGKKETSLALALVNSFT